jgi:predicted SprT family Zn-dependent metalloprotease
MDHMTPADVRVLAESLLAEHGLTGWSVEFMDNKRLHGQCDSVRKLIRLNRGDVFRRDLRFVKDTILHEIAHALTPRGGHGKEWRDVAYRIGVRDPGYNRYGLCAKLRTEPKPIDFQKKLDKAMLQAKRIATRIKRLETAMKKWQRRAKLYQTRLARVESGAA